MEQEQTIIIIIIIISYQPNASVNISDFIGNSTSDIQGPDSNFYKKVSPTYQPQINYVGYNSSQDNYFNTILNNIQTAVTSQGGSLRYNLNVYKQFRIGALKTLLKSNCISNGTLNQNTTPYVYFTIPKTKLLRFLPRRR